MGMEITPVVHSCSSQQEFSVTRYLYRYNRMEAGSSTGTEGARLPAGVAPWLNMSWQFASPPPPAPSYFWNDGVSITYSPSALGEDDVGDLKALLISVTGGISFLFIAACFMRFTACATQAALSSRRPQLWLPSRPTGRLLPLACNAGTWELATLPAIGSSSSSAPFGASGPATHPRPGCSESVSAVPHV